MMKIVCSNNLFLTLSPSSNCAFFSDMISLCSSKTAAIRPCHIKTCAFRRISAGEKLEKSDKKLNRSLEAMRRFSIKKIVSDSTFSMNVFKLISSSVLEGVVNAFSAMAS